MDTFPAGAPYGRSVRVNDNAVHIRRTPALSPDAEPAVYVHGHGGSSTNWSDLADLLSRRLDGMAVDLPGFGRSEPARSYGLAQTAAALAGVVSTAGSPVHLIGNSYGGTVALHLAARRPELVRTLTLISPAVPFLNPRWSSHLSVSGVKLFLGGARALRRMVASTDPEELVAQSLAQCCADPGAIPWTRVQAEIDELRQAIALPWRPVAEARSYRGLIFELLRGHLPGRMSLRTLARQLTMPTLVLWGEQDRILNVKLAGVLARLIPHARLAVLDRVGHLPHLEAPHRVADILHSFLAERHPRLSPATAD
jgi:pimeloyl-ACP methyl ester carboxylesterase